MSGKRSGRGSATATRGAHDGERSAAAPGAPNRRDSIDNWRGYWEERARTLGAEAPDLCVRGSVAELHPHLERLRDETLLRMLDLRPEDRLLDAGCGLGDFLLRAAPLAGSAAGVDISATNIDLARKHLTREGLSDVRLQVSSVTRLPFEDAGFDKAVCLSVLQYLTDEECRRALSELSRVVRPGGVMVIHAKNSRSPFGAALAAGRLLSRNNPLSDRRGYQRPWNWYLREAAGCGTVAETFCYGLHFHSRPAWLVSVIGSIEAAALRRKLSVKLGKEFVFRIDVGPRPKV